MHTIRHHISTTNQSLNSFMTPPETVKAISKAGHISVSSVLFLFLASFILGVLLYSTSCSVKPSTCIPSPLSARSAFLIFLLPDWQLHLLHPALNTPNISSCHLQTNCLHLFFCSHHLDSLLTLHQHLHSLYFLFVIRL